MFVPALFEGFMSDREVFRQSGITSLLTYYMAILVDKGFLVDDLVPGTVHLPCFLSKRIQMSEEDVLKTVHHPFEGGCRKDNQKSERE